MIEVNAEILVNEKKAIQTIHKIEEENAPINERGNKFIPKKDDTAYFLWMEKVSDEVEKFPELKETLNARFYRKIETLNRIERALNRKLYSEEYDRFSQKFEDGKLDEGKFVDDGIELRTSLVDWEKSSFNGKRSEYSQALVWFYAIPCLNEYIRIKGDKTFPPFSSLISLAREREKEGKNPWDDLTEKEKQNFKLVRKKISDLNSERLIFGIKKAKDFTPLSFDQFRILFEQGLVEAGLKGWGKDTFPLGRKLSAEEKEEVKNLDFRLDFSDPKSPTIFAYGNYPLTLLTFFLNPHAEEILQFRTYGKEKEREERVRKTEKLKAYLGTFQPMELLSGDSRRKKELRLYKGVKAGKTDRVFIGVERKEGREYDSRFIFVLDSDDLLVGNPIQLYAFEEEKHPGCIPMAELPVMHTENRKEE